MFPVSTSQLSDALYLLEVSYDRARLFQYLIELLSTLSVTNDITGNASRLVAGAVIKVGDLILASSHGRISGGLTRCC